jgi:cytochrome c oxidase subunit 2
VKIFPAVVLRLSAALVGGFAVAAHGAMEVNLPPPASEIAAQVHDLHVFMLIVIALISLAVFGAMFYAIIRHRKSVGHRAAHFHENTLVEIVWTAIPMLIIIAMAIPATKVILAYKDDSAPDLTVKVTGYQWKWSYDYLDEGVFFYSNLTTDPRAIGAKYYGGDGSDGDAEKGENYLLEVDNPMVVPVGKKVRLLLTAADVIHAWWSPELAVKQDAIPGRVTSAWFRADKPGVYRGQCAELCGKNHGFMPVVVRAVSDAEYEQWLTDMGGGDRPAEQIRIAGEIPAGEQSIIAKPGAPPESATPKEWNLDTLSAHGETIYNTACAACHQPNGEGLPPAFPPLKGGAITTGDIAAHIQIVLNGKPGTAMAAFNYLSDEDIAAVVTFERNAWGNDKGDFAKPEDVAAMR